MDHSPPGSSVHGIIQAGILEWVAMLSSRRSSWPKDWAYISCISRIARWFFTTSTTWKAPGIKNSCIFIVMHQGSERMGGNWHEQLEYRVQRKEGWQPYGWALGMTCVEQIGMGRGKKSQTIPRKAVILHLCALFGTSEWILATALWFWWVF